MPLPTSSPADRRRGLPAVCSAAALVFGVSSVVSAVLPPGHSPLLGLTRLGPLPDPAALDGLAAAIGLVLLVVSSGLRRRKRRAWWMAISLTSVGTVVCLEDAATSVGSLLQTLFGAAFLVCLVSSRGQFVGAPDPRSHRRAAATLVLCVAAATTAGVCWLWFRHDQISGPVTPQLLLVHTLAGLIGVDGPAPFISPAARDHAGWLLGSLGTGTAVAVMSSLLRGWAPHRHLSDADESRLRDLIATGTDKDSLAYFALRRDKTARFSQSGKAAICYRVVGGVCLASGDPLGDTEAWAGAIDAWLAEARHYAWTPAVLSASKRAAEAYRRAGLDALELGDEAIVDVDSFALNGRDMRGVRQAANRVHRRGGRITACPVAELSRTEIRELQHAAGRWREGARERGYSMALGRFADPLDEGCIVIRAYDGGDRLRGFLHFVPWDQDGLSLDLMRRDPAGTNGVVEAMVVAAITYAEHHRLARVSLNFATFRSVFARGDEIGAGPVLRVTYAVLRWLSQHWQIESLYRANAKYKPRWEPRYLCFERITDIPRVGLAALRAESLISWGSRPGTLPAQRTQSLTSRRPSLPTP